MLREKSSYLIRLQVEDSGGLTHQENLTLLVEGDLKVPVSEYVFRLYNTSTGKHLFPSNEFETDLLTGQLGWENEGIAFMTPGVGYGTRDLHRFFVESEGRHFYTANDFEKQKIIDSLPGFRYEGVVFEVHAPISSPAGAIPVVRYLNVSGGHHVYSTSLQEQAILNESSLWINEGIAWYGDPV